MDIPDMDGRNYSPEVKASLRRIIIDRLDEGVPAQVIATVLGVTLEAVYRCKSRYAQEGEEIFKAHFPPGAPRKLNETQMAELLHILQKKSPLDFGFPTQLWTQQRVREVIRRHFHLSLHRSTVGRVLHVLGLSPQVPLKRALERDPKAIETWKRERFPQLRQKVARERAALYFLDETGIRSTHLTGTTYGKIGERPVVESTGANFGVNIVSAVTRDGILRFSVLKSTFNSEALIQFLEHLLQNEKRKVYVVLDNHPSHNSRKVQDFVLAQGGKLELVFLPTYAPETNPDEWVWKEAKSALKGALLHTREELRKKTQRVMMSLARLRNKILQIFKAPDLAYIHPS